MAAGKEIRGKIKSVENTKKITKAMEMVAASKMRKAQERMRAGPALQRQGAQHRGQPRQGQPGVHAPVHEAERRESGRLHRRHDRQGPVRRHEHQRAARGDGQAARDAGRRHDAADRGDRQQGLRVPEPHRRPGGLACHPARRHAAPGQADRPGEGAAGRLCRGQGERGVPVLHQVHQHHEAGAGGRAAAAADAADARSRPTKASTAGTTSTSRTRSP